MPNSDSLDRLLDRAAAGERSVLPDLFEPCRADLVLRLCHGGERAGQVMEATTAHLIRYEVTVDTEGYLTVLNFRAEGKVERFLPQDPQTAHRLVPGQAAKLITALAPPVGREHTAVIWTRQPARRSTQEWHERIGAAGERGQVLVLAENDSTEEWTAVVITVVQHAGNR